MAVVIYMLVYTINTFRSAFGLRTFCIYYSILKIVFHGFSHTLFIQLPFSYLNYFVLISLTHFFCLLVILKSLARLSLISSLLNVLLERSLYCYQLHIDKSQIFLANC
jgi:hypothetical protein